MPARYHYLTLWYQPTFAESAAEPFAVLVEVHVDSTREIFGILKALEGTPGSVTGEVLTRLPDILTERLSAAADRIKDNRPILDALRAELEWNIYADRLEHVDSAETLRQLAYRLFAERVDVDREVLSRFREEHVDTPGATVERQYTIELVA